METLKQDIRLLLKAIKKYNEGDEKIKSYIVNLTVEIKKLISDEISAK